MSENLTIKPIEMPAPKKLYDYQASSITQIFDRIHTYPKQYNLLFQLPTGGGKTVIFSEITRRYIQETNKKVLILTHRIELCAQTSTMLDEFGVSNKIINSSVKELEQDAEHQCFVAMVETLNNRLNDEVIGIDDLGLIIIDEAHYNSFTKLFKFFEECFLLGVTATPLSSNVKLPMHENYKELIVGETIETLINKGVLAKANTYSYNVGLSSLEVGMNGDYTVKSSERLYSNDLMQEKLLFAYEAKSKGKKTLIFNNGINTSKHVFHTFLQAGYEIRHLDNTHSKQERAEILDWFRSKPDAILTSVSILTTGFDEPSVDTIILNRATKSLTLYYQMIGRGSRVTANKKEFTILDLGNNMARFGYWGAVIDWNHIFKAPHLYLEKIQSDEEIERNFRYQMPPHVRALFKNTDEVSFDMKEAFDEVQKQQQKSNAVLKKSLEQHLKMCVENSEDIYDALDLVKVLNEDIKDRIKQYSFFISKTTNNFLEWLEEDYIKSLKSQLRTNF